MSPPTALLGDVVEVIRNGFAVSNRKGVGGIPITRIETISNHVVDESRVGYANIAYGERDEWLLQPGDVLFSHINSVSHLGKCALYEGTPERLIHGMNLLMLRCKQDLLVPRYFVRALRADAFRSQLAKHIKPAVNQASVSIGALRTLRIAVPPLAEQRRIADILDKADAIRRKRKEAIALTEELLRSAFLEMFGDPVTNPKGWKLHPFGTLLAIPLRNGLSPASGGAHAANILTLSAITRGRFDGTAVKRGAFNAEPWDDVRVDQRDFLICRGNGNLAMVGTGEFPSSSDSAVVFPDTMIAARVDDARVSRAFLSTLWKSRLVREQIEAGARTTNGTFKVNQTLVESISIPVPGLRQQHVFEVLASQVSELSAKLARVSKHASDLFEALVDRAFRGELTATGKPQLGLFNAGDA